MCHARNQLPKHQAPAASAARSPRAHPSASNRPKTSTTSRPRNWRVVNAPTTAPALAPALALALALAMLMLMNGCGRPATTLEPDDRPRTGGRDRGVDGRDRIDQALADMSRYLDAAEPALAASPAAVRVVTFGPFVNQTDAPTARFAEFRQSIQDTLKARGRAHGLLFADDAPHAGTGHDVLQASALPIGRDKEKVLLRLAVVGPGRDDQRRAIWSDNLILPRP